MARITGGELLARCLAIEGIDLVFGLPCPELDPFLQALGPHRIRFIPVRHEAAAVHMAQGVYKTTGRVAAVAGNPGPGSANLLPGLITALHEGVPVLAITAQHRLEIVYPSPPSTFQGQDQLAGFAPSVKWGGPIFSFGRIPEVCRMAFREMWKGRPGPVQVEIPGPVVYATGEESAVRVLPPERYRAEPPRASREQLERVAEVLASAERPLVVAGSGVDRAGAHQALLRLVELLGCPAMPTMAGRPVLPGDHPQVIGGFGPTGDRVRREADVVLALGTRLGNLDLPYDKYWGDPDRQRIVQIDVDPTSFGVTRPLALGIVADLGPTLPELVEVLEKRGGSPRTRPDLPGYQEAWKRERREIEARVDDWHGSGLHPARAMRVIGEAFGREAIYVTDGGNTSLWANWFLPPTGPRSYLGIFELGMLGTGIPAAVGARLACPDRRVVCVTGDGAAGFHFMELQTAAREELPVVTVVFAEGAWSMEEPNPRMLYGRTVGTEIGEVRYDLAAAGLGCESAFAGTEAELERALARAREADAPFTVCLRTSKEANLAVPPDALKRFVEVYQGPID